MSIANRVGLLGTLALVAAAACSAAPGAGGEDRPAPHATPLPDLAKLAPSVQTQIRDAHARLMRLVNGQASARERSLAYGEVGTLLMAAQFPDAPEPYLQNAQALDDTDVRWPYYLAQVYRLRGEAERAVAEFDKVSQRDPQDIASRVWLGELYLQLGQPDRAAPRFAQALALQPASISARFGLGRAALATHDYTAAVAHFEDVLTRDATAVAAHYPLSLAYTALGQTAKADAHLKQRASRDILPADPLMVALDTMLESAQSYETRGIRSLEDNEGAAAVTWFEKGLALAPDNAALHHRLGAALSLTGDRAAARRQFEEAVRLSADQFLAHYSLGVMDQEDGRHDAAVARFRAALAARPAYVQARVRLAASLRRTRRVRDALAEYRHAVADDARLVEAHVGYAMTLAQLGRYREARDHFDDARRTVPESTVLTHGLARLLATAADGRVRDGARARALVEALVAQGRTLDLGETMAMTLAELGEFERAVAVQRDLLTAARRAGLAPVVARIERNLARYERRQPCRMPWTEQEWP